LFEVHAPEALKRALAAIPANLPGYRRMVVVTDDPRIPWEAMTTPDGELLGLSWQVSRMPWRRARTDQARARETLGGRALEVVAPRYSGRLRRWQASEIADLEKIFEGHDPRVMDGDTDGLRELARRKAPASVLHYVGHGAVARAPDGRPRYLLKLRDADLDVAAWNALGPSWTESHPLVFFNACDLGRGAKRGSAGEGWYAALLDAGAAGYIGGLWGLGMRAAGDFAHRFYSASVSGLPVSAAILKARRAFLETGDPTYLAYVYYGSPWLALSPGAGD
jgi:CHAT domain-containing protein